MATTDWMRYGLSYAEQQDSLYRRELELRNAYLGAFNQAPPPPKQESKDKTKLLLLEDV